MITLLEDNTVLCSDGANVNSGHPHKTGCAKSKAVAEAFTYRHDILYNREDREHIDELTFDGKVISIKCHVCEASDNPEGKARLVNRHSHNDLTLDPFEDQSKFSDRVKTFAAIVFDDQAKRDFIETLPKVTPNTLKTQILKKNPAYGRKIPNPEYGKIIKNPDGEGFIEKTDVPELILDPDVPPQIPDVTIVYNEEDFEELQGSVLKTIKAGTRKTAIPKFTEKVIKREDGSIVFRPAKEGDTNLYVLYDGKVYPNDWDGDPEKELKHGEI